MELKDFLHYYIGCRVDKDPMALDYPTIKGIHGDRVMISEYRYKTPHADGVFTRPEMYQYSGFVKPLLRRLEDMTEEEALHLAGIYSGAEKIKQTTGTVSNFFYFFCEFKYGEKGVSELMVMHNGEAWYQSYFDKRPKRGKGHNIINQFAAAHYLLSKGFDIFGLISAGLAIDAKTVK